MIFGVDGPVGIAFDNYAVTEQVATVALLFIMFYGGFGTNWLPALRRSSCCWLPSRPAPGRSCW